MAEAHTRAGPGQQPLSKLFPAGVGDHDLRHVLQGMLVTTYQESPLNWSTLIFRYFFSSELHKAHIAPPSKLVPSLAEGSRTFTSIS